MALPAVPATEAYLTDTTKWFLGERLTVQPTTLWVYPSDFKNALKILNAGMKPYYTTLSEAVDAAQPGDTIIAATERV